MIKEAWWINQSVKWLHFEEFWQVSVVVVKKLTLLMSWKKRGLSFSLQLIILKKRTLHRLNVSFRSFVEFTFTVSYLTNVGKISTDCTSTRLTGLFVSQSICFLSNFSHLTQQSQNFLLAEQLTLKLTQPFSIKCSAQTFCRNISIAKTRNLSCCTCFLWLSNSDYRYFLLFIGK